MYKCVHNSCNAIGSLLSRIPVFFVRGYIAKGPSLYAIMKVSQHPPVTNQDSEARNILDVSEAIRFIVT